MAVIVPRTDSLEDVVVTHAQLLEPIRHMLAELHFPEAGAGARRSCASNSRHPHSLDGSAGQEVENSLLPGGCWRRKGAGRVQALANNCVIVLVAHLTYKNR